VRNDDLARGLERLADELARIKTLEPLACAHLARLLGAADDAELARELPWYVFATAFPGRVLAATLRRSPVRFEKLSGRLVAYGEFMHMLDGGFTPAEAYHDICDSQRYRLLGEVCLRYTEGDHGLLRIGRLVASVLFEIEVAYRRERQAAGIANAKPSGTHHKSTTKAAPARAHELRARGLTAAEIGAALGVSERTVYRYLASE